MYFIYLLLCSYPIDPFTILGFEHLSIDKFQVLENVNQRIFRLGNCERVGWEKKLQTFSQYLQTFIRPWEIFATENIIANRSNTSFLFLTSFEKYWSTYFRRLESIKKYAVEKNLISQGRVSRSYFFTLSKSVNGCFWNTEVSLIGKFWNSYRGNVSSAKIHSHSNFLLPFPTKRFTISEPWNLSIPTSELNEAWQSPDLEALKFW